MKDWKPITNQTILQAPVLVQTTFEVDEPADTFLDMSGWHKGIVFVNRFNIGRYFRVGPQQTLYVPGPLLKVGVNTVCCGIFFKDYNSTLKCFHFKQNMQKKCSTGYNFRTIRAIKPNSISGHPKLGSYRERRMEGLQNPEK